jgi:hypothetical protein
MSDFLSDFLGKFSEPDYKFFPAVGRGSMYEITIKERKSGMKKVENEWGVVSEKPNPTHQNGPNLREMGYLPPIDKVVTTEIKIFKQVVENLDLAAVIYAINRTPDSQVKS